MEGKDEHDYDAKGREYGKRLLKDMEALGDGRFVPSDHPEKVGFTMLKQQHFEVASRTFGTDDFDRVFVIHALAEGTRQQVTDLLGKKRIFWITVHELLHDLRTWYGTHERPAGLRHTLMGDLFHLLFGYSDVRQ